MQYPPRTYTAKRLLEHGALTARDFADIAGWPIRTVCHVLHWLCDSGQVVREFEAGTHRYVYRLVP